MKKYLFVLSLFFCIIFSSTGFLSMETFASAKERVQENNPIVTGKSAFLIDAHSGTILFEKEADRMLPIASMTKIVGLGLVFDAIENGKIKTNQEVRISKNAAEQEGSEAFLDENKKYKIEDLIKSVIISSANDSMVALAEAVSGTEENFVMKMNNYAHDHGMKNSKFSNSTGLPCADHYSTARDMAVAYKVLMSNKLYKKYATTWMDELVHPSGRKTELVNTNRLVRFFKGTTGGKTGFTNEAGFCLVSSAKRQDLELIAVTLGEESSSNRFESVKALFNYGFDNFENRVIVRKGEKLCDVEIKNSIQKITAGYAGDDFVKLLKKGDKFECSTSIEQCEVKAPVTVNSKIANLIILDQHNIVIAEIPIVSHENIEKLRIKDITQKIYVAW